MWVCTSHVPPCHCYTTTNERRKTHDDSLALKRKHTPFLKLGLHLCFYFEMFAHKASNNYLHGDANFHSDVCVRGVLGTTRVVGMVTAKSWCFSAHSPWWDPGAPYLLKPPLTIDSFVLPYLPIRWLIEPRFDPYVVPRPKKRDHTSWLWFFVCSHLQWSKEFLI